MKLAVEIYQVDAFTEEPFKGNPAAVCILPRAADAEWMQKVAREVNLSETAFLHPEKEGYRLRWFTPEVEVELCGHATLASAHVLWEREDLGANDQAQFHTLSGLLSARLVEGWVELSFPAERAQASTPPQGLLEALSLAPAYVGKNRFDYLIEVASEDVVRSLRPDFRRLAEITTRGVIVTSLSKDPKFDFVSRFFAPAIGIDEDPVTGSAHCCLGPFWAERIHKVDLIGYQASKRGGVVRVRLGEERVYLSGKAVTVIKGQLLPAMGWPQKESAPLTRSFSPR